MLFRVVFLIKGGHTKCRYPRGSIGRVGRGARGGVLHVWQSNGRLIPAGTIDRYCAIPLVSLPVLHHVPALSNKDRHVRNGNYSLTLPGTEERGGAYANGDGIPR